MSPQGNSAPTVHGATVLMLLTNAYDPDPRVRAEALALSAMGCRVRLLAWDRDLKAPKFERAESIDVERVHLPSRHGRGNSQLFCYARLYWKMLRRAWRTSFDAVHCHDLDTLPAGFLLAKLKRKPLIYDAHESFTGMLAGSVHPLALRVLYWLETRLIRRIDLLITVGEKLRRHFAGRGAKRSVVVGNWKRASDFIRSGEENRAVRRRWGIPENSLTLVSITQLLKDRRLEELCDAVASTPDVYLILGGKGVLEPAVRQWAEHCPRIVYAGFLGHREIADCTCAADVVYYGFDPANPNARFSAPNKLFEALAAGRPLITGDFGEIAEVVRAAKCGIVLPEYSPSSIRQAIAELSNRALRAAMGRNARQAGLAMNAEAGSEILFREYSRLLPGRLEAGEHRMAQMRAAAAVTEE